MDKELQQNESDSINSYKGLIKELKSSSFEYYDSRKVDAFSFFISNFNDLQQGCRYLYNNKSTPIFLYLEEHCLLKKSEHNEFNFFNQEFSPFSITEFGYDFYKYVQQSIK